MTRIGFTLSSEEHPPRALVEHAVRAEAAGFDFCSISDHFHPWVTAQGHSPFVWSVLGAVAEATDRIPLAVGVTCPLMRIHPAIVAHAAATASLLLGPRFVLGVGTGEALNEHILGDRWPPPEIRLDMLDEAVGLMRALWTGETVDHHGAYYTVENARIFDPPEVEIPVVVSAFGPHAARRAAEMADGLWASSPDEVSVYEEAGGSGPRYGQVHVCVGDDLEACRATVAEQWPNSAMSGQLAQDLPTFTHVEQAVDTIPVESRVESIPHGPDPQPVIDAIQARLDDGFDHVHLHQIGPDQGALFRMWEQVLRQELHAQAA